MSQLTTSMDIKEQIKKLMAEQDLDTALTRLFIDYPAPFRLTK